MTIDLAALRAALRALPGPRVSIDKTDLELLIGHAEAAQSAERQRRMIAAITGGAGTGGVSAAAA